MGADSEDAVALAEVVEDAVDEMVAVLVMVAGMVAVPHQVEYSSKHDELPSELMLMMAARDELPVNANWATVAQFGHGPPLVTVG